MLLHRYPHLGWLSLTQALYWSCAIIGIALTALVGQRLTPWPLLATLPLALLVLGTLLSVGPVARWMQQEGRTRGLRRGALMGVAAGVLAATAVSTGSFVLFCAAMLLLGGYQASAGFYRFAAIDGVAAPHQGRAASWVVAGGVLAALIAPTLAVHAVPWLPAPMAGAYACIAVLAALAWLLLGRLPASDVGGGNAGAATPAATTAPSITRRALWQRPAVRLALGITACGHGLMILIMNATPLAMQHHGHGLAQSTQVIQWHVLGMFLPSFIAGPAIDKLGARAVAWLGLLLLAASAVLALQGLAVSYFLLSSLLLGAGWNLMLLAGTTLLAQAYAPHERAVAQPLMEWTNSAVAAAMSFGCGALMQTLGWQAINAAALILLAAIALWLAWPRPALLVPIK